MELITDAWMDESPRDMPALELALLREGVERRDATHERCSRCHRTPLAGERIYVAEAGPVLCELCCSDEGHRGLRSQLFRGPELGRGIRILDQHAA
jgi:hypothetical protein